MMRVAIPRVAYASTCRLFTANCRRNAPLRINRRSLTPPLSSQSAQLARWKSTEAQRSDSPDDEETGTYSEADHEHAVISTFDLFSIGIGPSSSHTVGPMRAGNIFVADLVEAKLLQRVHKIRVSIYGSLALTGEGHMTPSALLLGLESADVETVDTAYVPERFNEIKSGKKLTLGNGLGDGKGKEVAFDYEREFVWEWGKKLPLHSNGMRLTVFDSEGYVLAMNDMFSVGGGFVVNGALSINPHQTPEGPESDSKAMTEGFEEEPGNHPIDLAENMYYKEIRRSDAEGHRRTGAEIKTLDNASEPHTALSDGGSEQTSTSLSTTNDWSTIEPKQEESSTGPGKPLYPFHNAASLLSLCHQHNLTIAQLVYENEKSQGYTDEEIYRKLFKIWQVMDESILEAVQAPQDSTLPGSLQLRRRAPALYRRLTRGLYPTHSQEPKGPQSSPRSQETPPGSLLTSSTAALTKAKTNGVARRQPQRILGRLDHPLTPCPTRRTSFPAMDYLSVYAIAVNETNAAGGRIVTAPTNGAAGIIPAVLKYTIEFISDDPERDIPTFLLTAAAIGMLYKRGATISAAEGKS